MTNYLRTLEDMKSIRQVIESMGSERPALLRKDFLFDDYQIYEARANGADTILLIIAAFLGPNSNETESKKTLWYPIFQLFLS